MNEESEANFQVPINFTNVPSNIIFTNNPPKKVNIRIKDKGIVLLNYGINNKIQPVDIDFNNIKSNKGVVLITDNQLNPLLKKRLLEIGRAHV